MSCIKKYDVAIDKTYVETLINFDFDFYLFMICFIKSFDVL